MLPQLSLHFLFFFGLSNYFKNPSCTQPFISYTYCSTFWIFSLPLVHLLPGGHPSSCAEGERALQPPGIGEREFLLAYWHPLPPTGINSARTRHVLSSWAGIHHSCPQFHHDLQPAGLHIHILLIYISDSFGSASGKCLATWAHLVASSSPCWGVGVSETLPCPLTQSLLVPCQSEPYLFFFFIIGVRRRGGCFFFF